MITIARLAVAAAGSLMVLLPTLGRAQPLIVLPDFDVVSATAGSCGGVDYVVQRTAGMADGGGPIGGYGTTSRIVLRYPTREATYRSATVATVGHAFTASNQADVAGPRWTVPPDADFDGGRSGTLTVVVDPDGRRLENNETNNTASVGCLG